MPGKAPDKHLDFINRIEQENDELTLERDELGGEVRYYKERFERTFDEKRELEKEVARLRLALDEIRGYVARYREVMHIIHLARDSRGIRFRTRTQEYLRRRFCELIANTIDNTKEASD